MAKAIKRILLGQSENCFKKLLGSRSPTELPIGQDGECIKNEETERGKGRRPISYVNASIHYSEEVPQRHLQTASFSPGPAFWELKGLR